MRVSLSFLPSFAIAAFALLTACQTAPVSIPPQGETARLSIDRLAASHIPTGGADRLASDIDMIVIHTIGGPICEEGQVRFDAIGGDARSWRDWFLTQTDKSIHYVIGRDGAIAQQRRDLRTAGHVSHHGVKPDVNARSIGIELVNDGNGLDPFPRAQLDALRQLVGALAADYKLGPEDIYSHAELDPRPLEGCEAHPRRVDPGPLFPMDDLKTSLIKIRPSGQSYAG